MQYKSTKIIDISAREILDSRGNPTVEATVTLSEGITGTCAVPSGASTGQYEAVELRDGDNSRYLGKGVLNSVRNIEEIIKPALLGMDAAHTHDVDQTMIDLDGTDNKSNLGANSILAVSIAAAKSAATAYGIPLYRFIGGTNAHHLPVPMMNILNGGAHASNSLDIQEFMILPVGAGSFRESLRQGTEVYHHLKKVLTNRKLSTNVGDEGGFAPDLFSDREALELILEAIESAGYTAGRDILLALDVAASEWGCNDSYLLPKSQQSFTKDTLIAYYEKLCAEYPICSLEDPLDENDFDGFASITDKLGSNHMIVGDDLFVTNASRLSKGIEMGAANSILVKANQIGTLSETLSAINTAKKAGYETIISHRSGETEDTFIADLAVGVNAGFIKSGAPCRTERICKYNRLLAIEQQIETI